MVQLKSMSVSKKSSNIYEMTIDTTSIFSHTITNFLNNNTYYSIPGAPKSDITQQELNFKYFCVESGLIGPGVIQLYTENNTYNVHVIKQSSNNSFEFQLLEKCFTTNEDKDKDKENPLDLSEFDNKTIRLVIPKSIYNSIFRYLFGIINTISNGN